MSHEISQVSQETPQLKNFNDALSNLTKWQLDLMLCFFQLKFHIELANVKHFAKALLKCDFYAFFIFYTRLIQAVNKC